MYSFHHRAQYVEYVRQTGAARIQSSNSKNPPNMQIWGNLQGSFYKFPLYHERLICPYITIIQSISGYMYLCKKNLKIKVFFPIVAICAKFSAICQSQQ
jgi:hypothetical protein